MQAAGLAPNSSDVVSLRAHHHLPMLHDPENDLGVELHTDVVSRSPDAVISTAWFCEMARPVVFRNQRVRLPEPTRNSGHTIFHSEIFHGLYALNKIQLRHLLDLALIWARHEGPIDWNELAIGFRRPVLERCLPRTFTSPTNCSACWRRSSSMRRGKTLWRRLCSTEIARRFPIPNRVPKKDPASTMEQHRFFSAPYDSRAHCFQSEAERLSASCTLLAADRNALQAAVAAHAQTQIELDNITRAREELQHELTRIQKSRSWRLTGPLRVIAGASRRWLQ